jgi:integrase
VSTQCESEQYCLFERGVNLTKLRQEKEKLMQNAKAPNTLKAYRASWKAFEEWCNDNGLQALPAHPETLNNFLTWGAGGENGRQPAYKSETLTLAVSAARHYHLEAELPLPINQRTRDVLSAIRRKTARRGERKERAGKEPLTVEQLRQICRTLGDTPIDRRDHAIILLGFASALRRSEIVRLATTQVHFEGSTRMRLWVPWSKTDQEGEGRDVWIPSGKTEYTCPVRAVKRWLAVRGEWPGPLFTRFLWSGVMAQDALSEQGISSRLKDALARIGQDPKRYGAHSMRSGMITAAHANGKSLRSIMDRSGHASVETVMRYAKSAPPDEANDVLAGVL